jgi:hypothetical protein
MQAGSLAELVRFAKMLQIPAARSRRRRMSGQVRKLVAVVDDDPRILESLQELLESAGYDVSLHSSGSSLLASGVSNLIVSSPTSACRGWMASSCGIGCKDYVPSCQCS